MKTKLEQAMECVVNVYHQYCILDPVDDYLHLKEFQKLMKEQAKPFLRNTTPPNVSEDAHIKQMFQEADKDRNGHLKFIEFLCVLAEVADEAHERSHDLDGDSKKPGSGHSH